LVTERSREILAENCSFIAVFDSFPVNEGHALIISKRHISTFFEVSNGEATDLLDALAEVKARLDGRFHPDGYNIGVNCGEAAGQTIPHLHVHLIPRYPGDVENPRGGVRNFKAPLVHY
jgi:diadenosine tetraphosphate (Ap4A) HIT family hydrolase